MNNDTRVAIVTGGSSGIGLATIKAFAALGWNVVIADLEIDDEKVNSDTLGLSNNQRLLSSHCDVSSSSDVTSTVNNVMENFGRLDVIVNNAGMMKFKPIVELDENDWLTILKVDLLGSFYFIQQGFRVMKPGSAIVNVSSVHAIESTANVAPYAAAKTALLSLTRSSAIEGKPKGIRVNAVLPGAVDTPMLWQNPNIKSGLESIGKNDVGKPEDIARAIVFLAGTNENFIQGASLLVDGGRLAEL
jgi:NAD(P)-dependent dehydrogenase (short-subunit alcohol dehydrogenase family)